MCIPHSEVLVQSFVHFSMGLPFFLFIYESPLYILEMSPCWMRVQKIFASYSVIWIFHL